MAGSALLVGDDGGLLVEMSQLLHERGYNVACTTNPAAAVESVLLSTPSTIILDVSSSPVAKPRRLVLRLRGLVRRARIVVMPPRTNASQLAWALRADGYIGKPYRRRELLSAVAAGRSSREVRGSKRAYDTVSALTQPTERQGGAAA